jgi:hypothetical protein
MVDGETSTRPSGDRSVSFQLRQVAPGNLCASEPKIQSDARVTADPVTSEVQRHLQETLPVLFHTTKAVS